MIARMASPERLRATVTLVQGQGLLFAVVLMIAIFSIGSSRFLTQPNIVAILVSVAVVGLVAVPGAMLILSGYVDFSVGSVAVLGGIMFGELVGQSGLAAPSAVAVVLGVGALWGLIAGLLICKLDFSAIVVTLGGFAGLRGLAELISKGQSQFGFGPGFGKLGNGELLEVPVPVWLFAAFFLIGFFVWYRSPFGRHMTATGADPVAAHALGIKVKRIPLVLYVASGLLATLGGLIQVSQLDASSLSVGVGLEIEVLTAILLGGVAFSGGRGSLLGVLTGVLFIGILDNGLVVMNISPFISQVAVGAALVFAAAMDVVYRRLDRIVVQESKYADDAPVIVSPAPVAAAASGPDEAAR